MINWTKIKNTSMVLALLSSCSLAYASSTRTIDADSVTSSDHTKTYSLPAATTTLVGTDSTQALSNKTIDCSSNTCSNFPSSPANFNFLTKTVDYTLVVGDYVFVNASGHTFTLPSASGNGGKLVGVMTNKTTDATVQRGGTDTIQTGDTTTGTSEGLNPADIQFSWRVYISDGTSKWYWFSIRN